MVDLAVHYSSITPESIRTQYTSHLFGAGAGSSSTLGGVSDPSTALCFDLSAPTVLRRTRASGNSLFLVDTRTHKAYDLGHLAQTQWHLDAKLVRGRPCHAGARPCTKTAGR